MTESRKLEIISGKEGELLSSLVERVRIQMRAYRKFRSLHRLVLFVFVGFGVAAEFLTIITGSNYLVEHAQTPTVLDVGAVVILACIEMFIVGREGMRAVKAATYTHATIVTMRTFGIEEAFVKQGDDQAIVRIMPDNQLDIEIVDPLGTRDALRKDD